MDMAEYFKLSDKTPDITGELLFVKTINGSILMARYDYLENSFVKENPKKTYLPLPADQVEYWSLAK